MKELKRIAQVLKKAAINLFYNFTNPRGWGFLMEVFLGIGLLFVNLPVTPSITLALMLGPVIHSSLLEIGILNYRKEEKCYKYWYMIKGVLAAFGLIWIDIGEKLPGGKIIISVVIFNLIFVMVYGKRLAAHASCSKLEAPWPLSSGRKKQRPK